MPTPSELKAEILRVTCQYSTMTHQANRPGAENTVTFEPGKTTVPDAGRAFDAREVEAVVSRDPGFLAYARA